MKKLSVTIISGFENTGKTSVLIQKLRQRNLTKRSAIIMNDISEVITSVSAVQKALGRDKELLLQLPNGCICCTLDQTLLQLMEKITESSVEHLFIEANATAEPWILKNIIEESKVADQVYIKEMITVIDASTFMQNFLSTDELRHRGLVALPYDDRIVSEVLADQIEYADTLIITKSELISEADAAIMYATLAALNPTANICFLNPKKGHLNNGVVTKFTFKSERPFHPQRLYTALQNNTFKDVLRARGTAWFATRPEYKIRWSQTGNICFFEAGSPWWHQGSTEQEELFNKKWLQLNSKRYQQIEFIGTNDSMYALKKN